MSKESISFPQSGRCEKEKKTERRKKSEKQRGRNRKNLKNKVRYTAPPLPPSTSLSALVEETTLDIDLFTAAKNPSLCGFGRDSGAGASGRIAGCATLALGLSSSSSSKLEAPPLPAAAAAAAPLEPKADAGATGTEEEPATATAAAAAPPAPELASPPLLLLLLVLPPPELAPPPSFALVAWNFGSLWEGTLAKLPGAAALPGLEEVEDAPSASASSASMPSVKGVAVLFLLLSPEEEAWARGGAEGA